MGIHDRPGARARDGQILDNFGADGWELVQVVPGMNPESLVAYFKRGSSGTPEERLTDFG